MPILVPIAQRKSKRILISRLLIRFQLGTPFLIVSSAVEQGAFNLKVSSSNLLQSTISNKIIHEDDLYPNIMKPLFQIQDAIIPPMDGEYFIFNSKGKEILRAQNARCESDAANKIKEFVDYLVKMDIIEVKPYEPKKKK